MQFSSRAVILLLVIIPLLFACDDKRTATARNFENALREYYDNYPECTALPIDFPIDAPVATTDNGRRQAEVLVGAGLLKASGSMSPQYTITAAGEQAIRKGPDSFLGGMTLCFARRKIVKVTSFTPPAALLGAKVSRVTYDYELQDVAPWAKNGPFQQVFPQIGATLAQLRHSETDSVVLTDDGWRDERALR